jgi:hypothetical protein
MPFRVIEFSNAAERALHDKLVTLVEQMTAGVKELSNAKSDRDKDFYENKCASLDRHIDAFVYELYGLTADEVKVVERTQTNESVSESQGEADLLLKE